MDQTEPWQFVPRQVFTPYDCVLISVALRQSVLGEKRQAD